MSGIHGGRQRDGEAHRNAGEDDEIFLDSNRHFEDDEMTSDAATVPQLPWGNHTSIPDPRVRRKCPSRNHTGGPFLPARMALFFTATDMNRRRSPGSERWPTSTIFSPY